MELFIHCKACKGNGFVNDYEPCPKCDWKPKKLSDDGQKIVDFLRELNVHHELPDDWT